MEDETKQCFAFHGIVMAGSLWKKPDGGKVGERQYVGDSAHRLKLSRALKAIRGSTVDNVNSANSVALAVQLEKVRSLSI